MNQALRILRDRYDVAAIAAIFLVVFLFPRGVPGGIFALGIVSGAAMALHAIGLILVYRTNRIINFAQVQIGAVAATLFVTLVNHAPLARAVQAVCPPCLERPGRGFLQFNYYLSLTVSLALAVGVGWLVHTLVVKRFSEAPRLVLTVATIFVGQILASLQQVIPNLLLTRDELEQGARLGAAVPPFAFTFTISPARFGARDVLTVAAAALAVGAVAWFLRRTPTGVATRATAENPRRVLTLGVDVDRVNARIWMIVGGLSGVAAVVAAMAQGAPAGGEVSFNVAALTRILAVAVIARMASLPVAGAAALALGVLESAFQWSFDSVTVLEGVLLLVIAGVLVLQRHRASRAELEQASAWRAAREVRPTPPELRSLGVVRRWYRNQWIVLAVVGLGLPWILSPAQTNLASVALIVWIVVLSLLVLTGWAGQISLGQFAFAAIGGYVVATLGWPFPLPLLVAGLVGAAASVVVGLPALKLRGLHLAITTLAFALTTTALLLNPDQLGSRLPETLDRPTLVGMSLEDERVFYYVTLVIVGLVILAVAGLKRSRTARALVAARDNEVAAQSFGINLTRVRLEAFALAGFLAAFAGGLYAYHQHGVRVQSFAPEQSVTVFLLAVIGGLGSIVSVSLGALFYAVTLLFGTSSLVQALSTGLGGLLVVMLLPGGLGEAFFSLRDAILRRVARRHRIVVPSLLADADPAAFLGERSPIAPRTRPGGGTVFVPERYALDDQWALQGTRDGARRGERGLRPMRPAEEEPVGG